MTQKQLKKLLRYNPKTGKFRSLKTLTQGRKTPCIAGQILLGSKNKHGRQIYLRLHINGQEYYAHRLAWLYVYGQFPRLLDHKNHDGLDNRINNLRLATVAQNYINAKKRVTNTSQFKGVWKHGGQFCAETSYNGKKVYIGLFDDPKTAHAAYLKTITKLYGEFAHAG